ncbi:hypothetical protein DGG96_04340 [Legionella qingyii]|uniref:Fir n=1 Tax=Legionella qingyii TaxID=2184757 RepID=A0A317U6N1_9GAMM|nr:hypothetical protein [Legionella qingyii]PWY56955.1 hypothetical protein DGG96_04340 [Legionella qingyii]RUR24405.1 hypothetical protein ELY20_04895 [Legionella qingyii]RUR27054.1 hypothetical protein ELY16_05670 [Legionella qingyii]
MGFLKRESFFAHEHGQGEPAATEAGKGIDGLMQTVQKMETVALAKADKEGLSLLEEAIKNLNAVKNVITQGPEALQSLQTQEAKQQTQVATPLFQDAKQQLQATKQQEVAQEEVENESGSRLGMS